MSKEESIKKIMDKYNNALNSLDSCSVGSSPWSSLYSKLNAAKASLYAAQDDFNRICASSEILLPSEVVGNIGGHFTMASHAVHHLNDLIEFHDRTDMIDDPIDTTKGSESSEAVTIDLDQRTLAGIALFAHRNGMTINEAVNEIVRLELAQMEESADD